MQTAHRRRWGAGGSKNKVRALTAVCRTLLVGGELQTRARTPEDDDMVVLKCPDDHAAVLPVHAFGATLAHIFRCGTAAVHPSAHLVGLRGSTHPEAVRIQKQSTCARARGARFMRTLHGKFLERLYSGNAL